MYSNDFPFSFSYPGPGSLHAGSSSYVASSANPYGSSVYSSEPHYYSYESSDDGAMPWEQRDWIPRTSSGKQKSPNMIRNELQRYIDACKADGSSTQTRIIEKMGVNSNSFRKFMDPGTYKDQWSATQNGTYWAAARLLAEVAFEKELAGKSGKRKSAGDVDEGAPRKKSTSAEKKIEALELIRRINSVRGVREGLVYDTCPELVKKIKDFLQRDGMTKANFLLGLGGINSNSLNQFLAGKRQDQCGNITYRAAYVFFENFRILEGKGKSAARLRNERQHPYGFSLEKARLPRVLGKPYKPYGRRW